MFPSHVVFIIFDQRRLRLFSSSGVSVSSPVRNEIDIDFLLGKKYHGGGADGNGFLGLQRSIQDVLASMRDAAKDMSRAGEPCQLSNF